jgi:hypothetical protein
MALGNRDGQPPAPDARSVRRSTGYCDSAAPTYIDGSAAGSRRVSASWLGGTPNMRRYSRLNCDGLS